MNRFHPLAAALLFAASSSLMQAPAGAQEVYKWTDASGKVHYGDRAAAPQSSTAIKVSRPAPSQPAVPETVPAAPLRAPALPRSLAHTKSVPVDPSQVGPQCKGLVDKIASVPAGQNWEALSRQFSSACPGITYECTEYESSPQNNRCAWVKRSGSSVLLTKKYP